MLDVTHYKPSISSVSNPLSLSILYFQRICIKFCKLVKISLFHYKLFLTMIVHIRPKEEVPISTLSVSLQIKTVGMN